MRQRALLAAPLLAAIALFAGIADAWLSAVLLAVAVLAASAAGPCVRAAPISQWLCGVWLTVLVFAASSALPGAQDPGARVPEHWFCLAAAALLHCALRLAFREPHGGHALTYVLGMVPLVACGKAWAGASYALGLCVYLLASLWALRALDAARPSWAQLSAKNRAASLALPAAAAVLTALACTALVPLDRWIQARFEQAFLARQYRVGFSDRMRLGALRGMLSSERIVLRIRGPRTDYLRGAVFDRYRDGRWSYSGGVAMNPGPTALGPPAGGDVVELRPALRSADRFFLPLGLAELGTTGGSARFNSMGIAYRGLHDPEPIAWFRAGPQRAAPIAPPGAADLDVPEAVRARIAALAEAWSRGAADVPAQLARIEQRLSSDYRYSLSFERGAALDPVVDFLFEHREGHCEYFASAMALLARSRGVAARVVGGYRVVERNPLGDYYIVREKNAHAWVEAYLPEEGWTTYDPTPLYAQPQNAEDRSSLAGALRDSLGQSWERLQFWIARQSAAKLGTIATLCALCLAIVQWLRAPRPGRLARGGSGAWPAPLPCLADLLAALQRAGTVRASWESLERFAERIPSPQAAQLIARYAALRYGGEGDGAQLARAMHACAAELTRAPASPSTH